MTDLTGEPWEVLESRYLLRSPWRDIRVDRIRLHTGAETEYSYFEMHDAGLVVPLAVEGQIVVLRQYRARDGRIDDGQPTLALLMAEPTVRAHLATRGG